MTQKNAGIATFNTHIEAEEAVKELQKSGFNMKELSIIGKDYHTEEDVVGYYNMGDRVKKWGKLGAFWGGLFGLLFGSAFFFIPGVGPIMIAGPFISSIVGGLEGAVLVGGLDALGAALYSIGIPKDSIVNYETSIRNEKFILVVHGSLDEINNAKNILKGMGHEVQVHSA